mmetsp:Transcript_28158/g.62095  ORF Transcript_28158/g.62095 Transcript_28158/m.62095 type:complete len:284 (-) Transcript_28158:92-943(-)|eukprot:CAMPEP_0204271288 /NCGR_PEP_ID=MMETSP0468-20130131/19405_1 /ASSEMBLY_ACC=CAM_ASM_000383 /TAXON_ID=2969 /ORGANISM="Oxyrrhis marina" /LENGTH=283 /DNA_ID=CAMNT_0051246919 /DNA_START=53 /DNA_END=904 /DNA_ORIENTATION=-
MATQIAQIRVAQGWLRRFQHQSASLGGLTATFAAYLPDSSEFRKLPALYYLSGLTCTDENFSQKAGAFQAACDNNVILILPDTSPRGAGVEGEDETYDFGSGAGFYLDASQPKWSKFYNMYDYVVQELPTLVSEFLPVSGRKAITGHSMGGHGALTIGLKNPDSYTSVSAFSPICNPMECPWGQKAFTGYLGDDKQTWKQYDATELIKAYKGRDLHILIDQGNDDNFLKGDVNQLLPVNLLTAAAESKVPVTLRMQAGYDHSYYFISSFIGEHIRHHAQFLHA